MKQDRLIDFYIYIHGCLRIALLQGGQHGCVHCADWARAPGSSALRPDHCTLDLAHPGSAAAAAERGVETTLGALPAPRLQHSGPQGVRPKLRRAQGLGGQK